MKPEHTFAASVLAQAADLLDDLGIPFVLEGGTLLGAVRQGDFCDDDWVDIDLTTLEPGGRHVEVCREAERRGFYVVKEMPTWHAGKHRNAKCKIAKLGPFGQVKIDIFFKRVKGETAWWTRAGRFRALPARHYQQTDAVTFHGREYRIPSDVEAYLTLRYGDWRTPRHRADYNAHPKDYWTEPTRVEGYHAI